MSDHDEFFRAIKGRSRRVAPAPVPELDTPKAPLITQGAMSPSYPIGRKPSPDELIRQARGQGSWVRVIG